jgi:hypothetical protein
LADGENCDESQKESLQMIEEVCAYYDVDKILKEIDFDIFIVGGDQHHEGF